MALEQSKKKERKERKEHGMNRFGDVRENTT
jgi:hypothetical protein